MAVLRLRGAPKFTAVALSPASLTGLRRGPQKQRATWSLPRKSRVEGVRSGEARRGQRSPGAGREEPGALRRPLASAGARGAPRAQSGPSEPGAAAPRVPAGRPRLQGPGTRPRGRPPKPRVGGTGRGCEGERPRSLPHGAGRRAGHRCHLLCGFASLDETARVDGLSKPEGCEGRAGGPLVPQPPCRFSSQRVRSVSSVPGFFVSPEENNKHTDLYVSPLMCARRAAAQESLLPAGPAHACWMPVPVGAQRAASPLPRVEIARPSSGSHPSRRQPGGDSPPPPLCRALQAGPLCRGMSGPRRRQEESATHVRRERDRPGPGASVTPGNILISDLLINAAANNANKIMQFKNSPTDGLGNKGIKITKTIKRLIVLLCCE